MIHKIFPIRKTPLKLPLSKPGRPCLNFHIKRCLGPCRGVVSVEEYSVVVEEVLKFMEGKREELILKLHERMNQHSEKMEFERAVIYRDMINNMNTLQKKQSIINYIDGEEDIVAFARREDEGQVVIFEVREGRLEGKKSFAIKGMKDAKEEEIFFSFFKLYYPEASFIPDKIITPSILKEESEEGKTLLDLLKSRSGKKVKFASPRAGHKRSLLRLAEKNAEMNLSERLLATKLKDQKLALEELKENLKLKEIPTVIECYDISHFQGTEPVASGVMFVDGKPYKNGYRHYKIKGYSGINDPGMMHEVIARRLQRLLNENESLPDLIVIDGGETQLGRASEAAIALGLNDLPMVGLAKKREEIYFPGEKIPYSFDENSPSMKLLRQIRDEAHRFGVTFHRERRNKATMKSLLDGIGDIGKERRRAVLKFFSDKKKIEDATEAELKEVPGIGEKLAKKIYESLKSLNSLPK
jgi:excinuclease ABC subunit C